MDKSRAAARPKSPILVAPKKPLASPLLSTPSKEQTYGIEFLYLLIENAYGYVGSHMVRIKDAGLVYVQGVNLTTSEPSSSGAGKSRMWKLFLYLFYGKKALGDNESIKQAEVVGKDFRIEVSFVRGGKTYIVRETRSHSKFEDGYALFEVKNGKAVKEGEVNDPRLLRARVQRILGMTYGEMIGMVIWPQGFGHSLVVGKPSERINFLSSVYGLTKYDDVHTQLSAQLKETKEKISRLLGVEGEYNSVVASTADGASVPVLKENIAKLKLWISKAEAHADSQRQAVGALYRKIDRIDSITPHWMTLKHVTSELAHDELALLHNKKLVETFDVSRSKLEADLVKLKEAKRASIRIADLVAKSTADASFDLALAKQEYLKLVSEDIPRLSAIPQVDEQELNDAKDALVAFKTSISESLTKLKVRAFTTEAAEDLLRQATEHVNSHTAKLQTEDSDLKELMDLRNEISSNSTCNCPKCKQAVDLTRLSKMIIVQQKLVTTTEESLTQYEERESELEALVNNLRDYAKIKEFVATGPERCNARLKLKSAQAKAQSLKSSIDKAEADAQTAAELKHLQASFKTLLGRDLDKMIASYETKVKEARVKRGLYAEAEYAKTTIDAALASLSISEDEAEDVILSVKELTVQSQSMAASLDKLNAKVTSAYVTLSGYTNSLNAESSKTRRLNELKAQMDELKALREKEYVITQTLPAYSNSGLKMTKLQLLLKALAERLPYWTKLLFTEKNFFIKVKGDSKKLSLISPREVKVAGVKKTIEVDVASLSGGEQSRVAICLMLAMADIVATSKRANMLVFDEVDRHMDILGQRLTASFLVPNLRRRKSALYLISHSQMIDPASFDRKLLITKHPTGETDIKYSQIQKRM